MVRDLFVTATRGVEAGGDLRAWHSKPFVLPDSTQGYFMCQSTREATGNWGAEASGP